MEKIRNIRRPQFFASLGFTLIEALASIAVSAIAMAGIIAFLDQESDSLSESNAARMMSELIAVSKNYIDRNYSSFPIGAVTAIDLAKIQNQGYVPNLRTIANLYRQTPCLLVRKEITGEIRGLLVTEGGIDIPMTSLVKIASLSRDGGGYISPAAPDIAQGPVPSDSSAQGAFRTWRQDLASFRASCSGTATGPSRLAAMINWDGNKREADYVYRTEILNTPDANKMLSDLRMGNSTSKSVIEVGGAEMNYLQFAKGGGAILNASCNKDGALSYDASWNSLVICKNSKWQAAQLKPKSSVYTKNPCEAKNGDKCTVTCEENESVAFVNAYCENSGGDPKDEFLSYPINRSANNNFEGWEAACYSGHDLRLFVHCRKFD